MNYSGLPKIREQTMGINYGFEKDPLHVAGQVRCAGAWPL